MVKRDELIKKLRSEGMTYEKIGELLGVSRQAVHQIANKTSKDYLHEKTISQKVKYVGLRKWMLKNRVSMTKLGQLCGMTKINKSLTGDFEPRKNTIDAILRVTGLTYEECFKEDSQTPK